MINNKMQARPASLYHLIMIAAIALILKLGMVVLPYGFYADRSLSLTENFVKMNLLRQVHRAPDAIQLMDEEKIAMLLKQPTLKRNEHDVVAWHYHGGACALDVYFSADGGQPDYVEFRALSLNADIGGQDWAAQDNMMKHYCLRDILDAQGVDTPSTFARQPTPTWDNPYRS